MTMQAQGDWENGFCGRICGGDCGTCLGSWFCSACLFGRTSARYSKFPSQDGEATNFLNGDCAIFYLASCCALQFIPTMLKRAEVRSRFDVPGNGCKDCLLSAFCTPCTLAQMNMEMKTRATGNLAASGVKDQYASQQGGMIYQAPAPYRDEKVAQASPAYDESRQVPVEFQQTGQVAAAGEPVKN